MSRNQNEERILVESRLLVATSIVNIFQKKKENKCFNQGAKIFHRAGQYDKHKENTVTYILVIHTDIAMFQLFLCKSVDHE